MNISLSSRRGSALLVVLGMLAFMVISAVAFSAWMRYSRLPSSYLRRSSASRLLAKAALAEAIDEIDAAIGNNPHPGVGTQSPRPGAGGLAADLDGIENENLNTRNIWRNRVYIGTNQLHSADDTVSTLTLEGLAYIPPAFVNEVRYYSRRSQAGVWKKLGFDSGRYAFCAIDVSDHFDVNALSANVARDSSAAGRISLAYLFENADHRQAKDASAWDTFMKNFSGSGKVPLVSVADYNLALYDKKPMSWESVFCRYVDDKKSDFYGGVGVTDPIGEAAEKVKCQCFVTDSWFPETSYENADDADYDLAREKDQPFSKSDLEAETPGFSRFTQPSRETAQFLKGHLSALGLAALYDYLDDDNVPVSLAYPSVERIPMICGIGSSGMDGSSVKINPQTEYEDSVYQSDGSGDWLVAKTDPKHRTVRQITYYLIDGPEFTKFLQSGFVKAIVAYPFRRGSDLVNPESCSKFTLEGRLSVFFATGSYDSRGGGSLLQVVNDNSFTEKSVPANGSCSVFHIPLTFSDYKNHAFDAVDDEQTAVREVQARLGDAAMASQIGDYFKNKQNAVLTVEEQWNQKREETESGYTDWTDDGSKTVVTAMSAIRPIAAGSDEASNLGDLKNGPKTVNMRSALWLRLKNGNNKTVDLVPAGVADDRNLLGANHGVANALLNSRLGGTQGALPLMLSGGTELTIGKEALDAASSQPVPLSTFGLNVMCVDPRWNWAPEHWFQPSGDVTKDTWLAAVNGFIKKNERECDIFMATSDAGYMQSVYELAFLPRFTDLKGCADSTCGDMTPLNSAAQTTWATDPEKVINKGLMWRSYHPFATDTGAARDDFEDLGIVNEGGGFKVNPYSDCTNVVMAAFANTPCDWWAASTNTESRSGKMPHISQSERQKAKTFNEAYAFNEYNADAKFLWKDLQAVAQRFIARVQENGNGNWAVAFNGLGWDEEDFCGVNLSGDELYDVDRKFLYGYWRECFAAKQQLFLVFVRAEPMMMGGGAAGQTPPQLGARAVALVWRDPTVSKDNNTPHKTRILFYRQFD